MAFWNTDRLRRECKKQGLIDPYREDRAIRCAYELGVGPEVFITSTSDATTHLPVGDKVTIPPGQFGLLITKEVVFVPETAIAFISIRARIKFQGLVNVSGFHVDPGFRGQLKFAVYNAGSRPIVLDQDERVFMIWYADLDAASPDPYPPVPEASSIISSEDVSRLRGEVASPAELKKQLEELRTDFDKKLHAVEQVKLFNRSILFSILAAIITVLLTLIKPYIDGSKNTLALPVETGTASKQMPSVVAPHVVLTLPAHFGVFVLGAAGIVDACVLAAAFVVRKKQS